MTSSTVAAELRRTPRKPAGTRPKAVVNLVKNKATVTARVSSRPLQPLTSVTAGMIQEQLCIRSVSPWECGPTLPIVRLFFLLLPGRGVKVTDG